SVWLQQFLHKHRPLQIIVGLCSSFGGNDPANGSRLNLVSKHSDLKTLQPYNTSLHP
uniref:Uncharacterized protein n=1 Tax=Anopheles atroparvus TaxID=41427 RepID=A0AAG5DRY9_ANOAO